jgi:hypothetical protein
LLFWVIFLGVITSRWLWKQVRPPVITNFLNISSALALIIPLRILFIFLWTSSQDPLANWSRPPNPAEDSIKLEAQDRPDIYYIILDGYARSDILKEIYNLDNADFLASLRARGFFVAEGSYSNYSQTHLSLASSLNFEYLDDLAVAEDKTNNRDPLEKLIFDSRSRSWLEDIGYKIYISGENFFSEIDDPAMVFYVPETRKLSTFESLLLESTMFEALVDVGGQNISTYTYQTHREKILNGFAEVELLAGKEESKYVFVHILAPHPPFVFDSQGNSVQPDWEYVIFDDLRYTGGFKMYVDGYREQLIYISQLAIETIDSILLNSPTPPIIILQADHGPASLLGPTAEASCLQERLSILNAYYFPDGNTEILYPGITPVNTFRAIFDTYFGTHLGFLPDTEYYSNFDTPYQFVDVTTQIDHPCQIPEQP